MSADASPSAVKTGSVQVKFADGSERMLQVHGISPMQFLGFMDELGINDPAQLTNPLATPANTLQALRMVQRVAAEALSFKDDQWTVKRLQESFVDLDQVMKIFNLCANLSALPKVSDMQSQLRKQTIYR